MGHFKSFFQRRHKKTPSRSATSVPSSPRSGSSNGGGGGSATPRSRAEELETVFKKFDSNGDGKISASELADVLSGLGHPASDAEIREMMAEADSDGDGFIDLGEFMELNTRDVDDAAALEDLREAFAVFDVNGDGSISAEELHLVLKRLGEEASLARCRRMITEFDRDGNGRICFDEFKAMMMGSSTD